ncbi:MAG: GNAT family N-acetyltransferase [Gammaproteobacteria bacterium]
MSILLDSIESMAEISANDWNGLVGSGNPFLRHEFLLAIENHSVVGTHTGWEPHFIVARIADQLVGAIPLYVKMHSWGEFVFDWAWANAYAQSGLDYYPKLVCCIPYSPITGPRILVTDSDSTQTITRELITACRHFGNQLGVSSIHWLFTNDKDTDLLQRAGYLVRTGYQFHWHNDNYQNFNQYLQSFSSRYRKKIKCERNRVRNYDIRIDVIEGQDVTEALWLQYYDFYASTFIKRGHQVPLNPEFFLSIGESMPDNTLLIMARDNLKYIAGAFFLKSDNSLYGRHWGTLQEYHCLHFEVCYYQALEYCISNHFEKFEAGAQGEHKIGRGFRPARTYSLHWITDPQFKDAINRYLLEEAGHVDRYITSMAAHLPFKNTGVDHGQSGLA